MKQKIGIMHIRDSSGIFGAERVILTLAKNINRNEFDFMILCMRRGDGKSEKLISKAEKIGIKVFPVDVKGRLDIKAVWKINNIIKNNNISIFHSHDFKSDFYGLIASLNLGVKRVSTAHGSTRDSILKKAYLFINEGITYKFFDRIVAVAEDLRGFLEQNKILKEKIEVIQNGLDTELLEDETNCSFAPPLPIKEGHTVFAVIGRLYPDKGHRYFIEALSKVYQRYPNITGLIIGDGPARTEITEQIKELNLEKAVFLCGVRTDMKNVYDAIDFLIIPSLTEGLPYVLLEAMANGIPVLSTSVGDIPHLIDHGSTGFLIDPGDIEGLSKYMMRFLKHTDKSQKMAQQGRDLILKNFSAKQMTEKTESLYRSLLTSDR